jgi:hypothetical protein
VLESWQRGSADRLYLLPLSMLVWVNLHGGFLGGFLLLGAYLAGNLYDLLAGPPAGRGPCRDRLHRLLPVAGACLLACLCNPRGYHILLFPFHLVSNKFIMDHVTEFLSPNFHEFLVFKYLLLLLIALFAVSRDRIGTTELVLALVFSNMALYSTRYIPLFALVLAPTLTRQLHQAKRNGSGRWAAFYRKRSDNITRMDARATGYLWPAAALIAVALATGSGRLQLSFDDRIKPVAAVEFLLKEQIPGNMFDNDEFGDYLIYRAYPSYRVFIDGRLDMYGAPIMREYLKVSSFEPGWERILEKYRITWIFFEANSQLSRLLLRHPDWKLIYGDRVANIFVKNIPQNQYLIDKYRAAQPVNFEDNQDAAQ